MGSALSFTVIDDSNAAILEITDDEMKNIAITMLGLIMVWGIFTPIGLILLTLGF